jgi:quercetin dioxygenase-like cupin family protein
MKTIASVTTAVALLFGGAMGTAQAQEHAHVLAPVDQAKWGPAPPFIQPGAQLAVLAGDPSKPMAYAVRLKFPAGYKIAAHSHPTDENVVVVSGALTLGMGDKLDAQAAGNVRLGVGGYALMPAGMNHYAFTTKQETTIVLYGQGPVDFKYVNPADDPRNAAKPAK